MAVIDIGAVETIQVHSSQTGSFAGNLDHEKNGWRIFRITAAGL
jgi:hypothetical protein